MISFLPIYASSHPEYSGITNPTSYVLEIDEHIYTIPYEIDAHVLAMEIDQELTSLLIGLENTQDSLFVIDLEHELINAENNEFAIIMDGYEIDYDIISDADSSTFSFYVYEGTQEIEIIGTHIIPEFPFSVILIFGIIITIIVVMPRIHSLGRNFI